MVVGKEAIVPRHLYKIGPGYDPSLLHTASNQTWKWGKVWEWGCEWDYSYGQIASSFMPRPSHTWTRLDCNIARHMSTSQSHWTKHSTRVTVVHHKAMQSYNPYKVEYLTKSNDKAHYSWVHQESTAPVIDATFVSISFSNFHFQFPFHFHLLLFHAPAVHIFGN